MDCAGHGPGGLPFRDGSERTGGSSIVPDCPSVLRSRFAGREATQGDRRWKLSSTRPSSWSCLVRPKVESGFNHVPELSRVPGKTLLPSQVHLTFAIEANEHLQASVLEDPNDRTRMFHVGISVPSSHSFMHPSIASLSKVRRRDLAEQHCDGCHDPGEAQRTDEKETLFLQPNPPSRHRFVTSQLHLFS